MEGIKVHLDDAIVALQKQRLTTILIHFPKIIQRSSVEFRTGVVVRPVYRICHRPPRFRLQIIQIKDILRCARVLKADGTVETRSAEQLAFGYRTSCIIPEESEEELERLADIVFKAWIDGVI